MTIACAPNQIADSDCQSSIAGRSGVRVAMMMSRFPKITETFVLREMIELQRQGIAVEVFPLRREQTRLIQPDAQAFVERAHFTPVFSAAIAWSNLVALFTMPARYLGTLLTLIRANFGCRRFLVGALVYFPKAVHLASRMKRLGITHLHAHFASHPAAAAYVIGRLSGIPYSFVAHGSDLHRDQHMLGEKTTDAAFVIAISRYNRDMILEVCGHQHSDKVHVVHCGIDPQKFSPGNEPTPYQSGSGPFRIVCVGTLHEVKGQTHLIEACRLLKEQGIDFHCHFLGGGPDREALQQQSATASLNSRVHFHGGCTSEQVAEHLRLADVLVAPSVPSSDGRREGIPVVLMEAMACGLPCISSRLSGIPELVDENVTGILTDPGDAEEICQGLERLARDPMLCQSFGAQAIAKIDREFSLPKSTQQLAELICHHQQQQVMQ